MTFVHWLDDAAPIEEARIGGKAAGLRRLHAHGFAIPRGFALTTDAYDAYRRESGLDRVLAGIDWSASPEAIHAPIAERLGAAALPEAVVRPLTEAYDALGERVAVAVRSSARSEDAGSASSAGIYVTRLNVRGPEAMLAAVRECYDSLWSERAILYRQRKRLAGTDDAMAVVILEMVDPVAAGVLFTKNPIGGSDDEMMVNATWGLGEAVVSGAVTPDVWVLSKSRPSRVVSTTLGRKDIAVVAAGAGDIERATLDEARAAQASLTQDQLTHLGERALDVEAAMGAPQDIEWAYSQAGELLFLQTRPITI